MLNPVKAIQKYLGIIEKTPEDKVEPPWLLCPHCEVKIHKGNPPKKVRESHQITHYMCTCGGVSHWLDIMVMVLVGFGRYRKVPNVTTQAPRHVDRFTPNRILPHDVLWLCVNTHTAYLFKKNALCRFTLNKLPRTVDGIYRIETLTAGRRIRLEKTSYVYDGYQFVPIGSVGDDDQYTYYSDVDFGDVIHQLHTSSPNSLKGVNNE